MSEDRATYDETYNRLIADSFSDEIARSEAYHTSRAEADRVQRRREGNGSGTYTRLTADDLMPPAGFRLQPRDGQTLTADTPPDATPDDDRWEPGKPWDGGVTLLRQAIAADEAEHGVFVGYSMRVRLKNMAAGRVTLDDLRYVRSWINRHLREDTAADWTHADGTSLSDDDWRSLKQRRGVYDAFPLRADDV